MLLIALLLTGLVPQDLKAPLEDPKDILKGVKAPPGWTVSLFAGPPNIGYPTCLTAAPGDGKTPPTTEPELCERTGGRAGGDHAGAGRFFSLALPGV